MQPIHTTSTVPTIALVAASRLQRGTICRAREQFDPSPFFRRARDYCERTGAEWYILDADAGLLLPQQVIGPQRRWVRDLSAEERAAWATRVVHELRARCGRFAEPPAIALYASRRYAEALLRAAPDLELALPLDGMGLAERVRWFDERLAVRPRLLSVA